MTKQEENEFKAITVSKSYTMKLFADFLKKVPGKQEKIKKVEEVKLLVKQTLSRHSLDNAISELGDIQRDLILLIFNNFFALIPMSEEERFTFLNNEWLKTHKFTITPNQIQEEIDNITKRFLKNLSPLEFVIEKKLFIHKHHKDLFRKKLIVLDVFKEMLSVATDQEIEEAFNLKYPLTLLRSIARKNGVLQDTDYAKMPGFFSQEDK